MMWNNQSTNNEMFYQEERFLTCMIRMIQEANKVVLDIYNTDFETYTKEDESPLTQADEKCNKLICKFLEDMNNLLKLYYFGISYDGIIIISEENKNMDYKDRKDKEWTWLVDPVDGTKEFVKKNGQFTINVGLARWGVPVFGIVSIPVTNKIYYGTKDRGSFKLLNGVKTELIREVKEYDIEQENIRIICSSSHMSEKTELYVKQFKNPELINIGSSIKLLYIAENKADVYPRLAPTSEWDTCAAHAVVKFAGGSVLNFDTGEELTYNKENLLNPHFIVH